MRRYGIYIKVLLCKNGVRVKAYIIFTPKKEKKMKKKFMLVVLSIVMALSCAIGLAACGSNVDGTYYMYSNGEKAEGMVLVMEDGKMTMKVTVMGVTTSTEVGTYKVDGKKVTVTATAGNMSGQVDAMEIVSDGVLKVGEGMYYCKDGKTPPAEE